MEKERTSATTKPAPTKAVEKETVIEQPEPFNELPVEDTVVHSKDPEAGWEVKDRSYYLIGDKSPISYTLPSRHTARKSLLYYNEDTNEQKEIRYASNQKSPFAEDQVGQVTLEHIVFEGGGMSVPKSKQALQKLMSLYHPLLNKIYREHDPVENAEDDMDILDMEFEAMSAAREMDVDYAEAIMRVEIGSKVNKMSSKEIKRDLLLLARRDPRLFLALANDDNVQLRNVAIRATEVGIIKLSQDQRTFTWASNGRKLITVPFDEHPYSAMAAYFKTDEGMEVFTSIEKKLA